jgi:hypothetical protein
MGDLIPILGILAGAIGVADTLPYIRDTLRGSTRPHRGTWLIWAVLAIVVSFSLEAEGATWSLIMPVVQAVLTTLIFLLAVGHGVGGLRPIELSMMAIAGVGVIGWMIAAEPLIATACVVIADILGAAMMVPKTWRDPDSETLSTFALASVAGALGAGAVGALDPALLLYPVYYCVVNGGIALLIVHRRRAHRRTEWTRSASPI